MADPVSIVPLNIEPSSEASNDPMRVMIEITENSKLSDPDKTMLLRLAQTRFTNRRRMAYTALYALVASLVLLFIAAFIDGFGPCKTDPNCGGILAAIKNSQALIAWLEGFLAAIVAAYFGFSALRPSS